MNHSISALHIGIQHYIHLADADLRGASGDASRWAGFSEHELQLDPSECIRIVSNRPGATAPTAAGIREGALWLGRRLGSGAAKSALLTFSGHGLTIPGVGSVEEGCSLAIAPADVGEDFANAISLEMLESWIAQGIGAAGGDADALLPEVTFVMDCCYARNEARDCRGLGAPAAMARGPRLSRVILAAQLHEDAFEIRTADDIEGALSHVLISLLRQWRTQTEEGSGVTWVRASYGDLVYRARAVLDALGVEQTPTLVGDAQNLALLPFLRPGTYVVADQTSRKPDGWREAEELSPGSQTFKRFTFDDGSTIQVMCLVVNSADVSIGGQTYAKNTEHWRWNAPSTGQRVQVVNAPSSIGDFTKLSCCGSQAVSNGDWTSVSAPPTDEVRGPKGQNWGFTLTATSTELKITWYHDTKTAITAAPAWLTNTEVKSPDDSWYQTTQVIHATC
ncbi:MAG: caspase family protein [Myxococcota bacterium]